jgi:hypothetical protein
MSDELRSTTRREIITKAAWVAPVILTLPAAASFDQAGSTDKSKDKKK